MTSDYEEFKSFCVATFNSWKVDPFRHLESISSVIEGLFEQFEKQKDPPLAGTPLFVNLKMDSGEKREVLRFSKGAFHDHLEKVLLVVSYGAKEGSCELASSWRRLTQEEKDLFNA